MSKTNLLLLITLVCLLESASGSFQVLYPNELRDKQYPSAPLTILPKEFNLTGKLVLSNPTHGCSSYHNKEEVKGNIVVIDSRPRCGLKKRARYAVESGAIGMVWYSYNMGKALLGIRYNQETSGKYVDSYQIPTLEVINAEDVFSLLQNKEEVIVNMQDTDNNPWVSMGKGAAGVITQVFFEIWSFIILTISSYKLFFYIKYRGANFSVTQITLFCEILTAIARILYFVQPLFWSSIYLSTFGSAFLILIFVHLSFISTLLIIFYWQEIIMSVNSQLSNQILMNLKKLRIPFILIIVINFLLDFSALLGRTQVIEFEFGNIYVISMIYQLILGTAIAILFFITSSKILKFSRAARASLRSKKGNRLSRVTVMILICGTGIMISNVGLILFVTPANWQNRGISLFIWWVLFLGVHITSLSKCVAFETPTPNASVSDPIELSSPSQNSRDMVKSSNSINL